MNYKYQSRHKIKSVSHAENSNMINFVHGRGTDIKCDFTYLVCEFSVSGMCLCHLRWSIHRNIDFNLSKIAL